MSWTKDNGKFAKDAAEQALLQVNYLDEKKPLIDKFTDEQTNLQAQINQLVADGDSSPEAAQARVGVDDTEYDTLKARLDAENAQVAQQLAQTTQQITQLDTTKADQSFVDAQLASIVSGAPKGTYTDLAALQAAYPSGADGVFLTLSDGHWHYWNEATTTWTDGGLYQAQGIADASVAPQKLSDTIFSKNLFNKNGNIKSGYYIDANGRELANAEYFISDYIPITNNEMYVSNFGVFINFYNVDKAFISGAILTANMPVATPQNAVFTRISTTMVRLDLLQFEKGSTTTEYVPFGYELENLLLPNNVVTQEQITEFVGIQEVEMIVENQIKNYKPFLTLNDAWVAWRNGLKFPVAFFGDSTFDGANTTGWTENTVGKDHNPTNAFSAKLQTLLRSATGNSILRIYNAGFSGRVAPQGISMFTQEFTGGTPYADVKMIGIGFGINDRTQYATDEAYREGFKTNLKTLIEMCYENNIQPFILTSQATVEPGVHTTYSNNGQYPLRTSGHIATIANEVKLEVAKEYQLELIDLTYFTERFLKYSQHSIPTIISDRLHFGNVGHEYEAGVLFAHLVPYTNFVTEKTQLDYLTQKLIKGVPEDKLTLASTFTGFKVLANYTKDNTTDTKIFDAYIFIDTVKPMDITVFKNSESTATYVKIDGVNYPIGMLSKKLTTLELGLHRVEVWTGSSNKVDFNGFIIE